MKLQNHTNHATFYKLQNKTTIEGDREYKYRFIENTVVYRGIVVYTIEEYSISITMGILESAAFWIVIAAASEIIALSPLKDNSVVEVIFHVLKSVKPKK